MLELASELLCSTDEVCQHAASPGMLLDQPGRIFLFFQTGIDHHPEIKKKKTLF
jgi:hypothetical protein